MKDLQNKINTATTKLCVHLKTASCRIRDKLREKDGSFFTENAMSIVIVVVIAAVVLLAVLGLFKDKIFPNLENKTDEFFALGN